MAYPDNLLSRGERVVLRKHPHWKVLVWPIIVFIVVIAGGFALAASLQHWQYKTAAWIGIAAIGLVLIILFSVVKFFRWRSEWFVISTHHVFFRKGILHRREHQIPLGNVQNIETVVTFFGRILGYGSLIVESAADQPLEFQNVAELPVVQTTLNQLIMDDRKGTRGDGMGSGNQGGYNGPPEQDYGTGQPGYGNGQPGYGAPGQAPGASQPGYGRPAPGSGQSAGNPPPQANPGQPQQGYWQQ